MKVTNIKCIFYVVLAEAIDILGDFFWFLVIEFLYYLFLTILKSFQVCKSSFLVFEVYDWE